jgi:hypothetical protein
VSGVVASASPDVHHDIEDCEDVCRKAVSYTKRLPDTHNGNQDDPVAGYNKDAYLFKCNGGHPKPRK